MTATARPRHGGIVTFKAVLQAMRAAHIAHGCDLAAVRAMAQQPAGKSVVVATGQPPVPGSDARAERLVPAAPTAAPWRMAGCCTGCRDLPMVSAGTPLLRLVPATPGIAGRNVYGERVPAAEGQALATDQAGAGTALAAADPNLIEATRAGEAVYDGTGVRVRPVLVLTAAAMTRPIHFDGKVIIQGDVGDGVRVRATGDIHVQGNVEGGCLTAEGDIEVHGTIRNVTAPRLYALGHLRADAIEGGHLEIVGGVFTNAAELPLAC